MRLRDSSVSVYYENYFIGLCFTEHQRSSKIYILMHKVGRSGQPVSVPSLSTSIRLSLLRLSRIFAFLMTIICREIVNKFSEHD